MLCNQLHHLLLALSPHPKQNFVPIKQSFFSTPTPALTTSILLSASMNLPLLSFTCKWHHVIFVQKDKCVWLILISIISLLFIYVVACVRILLLPEAE